MALITGKIAGLPAYGVEVINGRIQRILDVAPVEPLSYWLSPGFIDLQVNGFAGIDFSDRILEPEQAAAIVPILWLTGVTSFFPTLITNSRERLVRNFRILEQARHLSPSFAWCAPGYHLEGPYFPAGAARGVHDPTHLRQPDWAEFLELQEAAGGRIRIVTLAPELPGALDFIVRCTESGVVCAIGHTEATAEVIHAAVDAGARLSTHLGNGCANLLDRHRNPLWPQLANDALTATLICDTFHLPPEFVRVVLRAKGVERCILVTDAVHVAQLPPGQYKLVDVPVELLPSGKVVRGDGATMAGSSLTLNRAVAVFERDGGVPLSAALHAATRNPANLFSDDQICGRLETGAPANILRFAHGAGTLDVLDLWVAGRQVVTGGQLTQSV